MSSPIFTESANQPEPISSPDSTLKITCEHRWEIYHRLQSLDIDCRCSGFRPLEVRVKTPIDLLQLRSVVQSVSRSRADLVAQLNDCWQLSI